ncbi:tetraacyldisaccharide 4'-kinase [Psychroflexus tropicus]|uniref:tetraacyldisaccharide 4'-kinase n=1 Tax=Psychroflexus tropicus TaxID=197345 RepID=UPI0004781152|nr:tetraacyldisaccharide 4'-kinase [Psychroflexus tropicus]
MKYLRYLLFPFSVLYGCVMSLRNYLYNIEVLKSKAYSVPVLCVGNLNTGGTGKSPMIELLIRTLHPNYKIATLSRGYKRKTSGFLEVSSSHTSSEVGDEPLQFKLNFPELIVAVDENRQRGIESLQELYPDLEVILLDDAFQHRKVRPKASILLTTFEDLYTRDFVLPTGNLREFQTGAKRADLIIVTKCPKSLTSDEQLKIKNQLNPKPYQQLLFSTIDYSDYVLSQDHKELLENFDDFTLVTGIANPKPLVSHLKSLNKHFDHLEYGDHHEFSEKDLNLLQQKEVILTTQKDYMRLKAKLDKKQLYYLPIQTKILDQPEALENFLNESLV